MELLQHYFTYFWKASCAMILGWLPAWFIVSVSCGIRCEVVRLEGVSTAVGVGIVVAALFYLVVEGSARTQAAVFVAMVIGCILAHQLIVHYAYLAAHTSLRGDVALYSCPVFVLTVGYLWMRHVPLMLSYAWSNAQCVVGRGRHYVE